MSKNIANIDYELEISPTVPEMWEPGIPVETRITADAVDAPDGKDVLVKEIKYQFLISSEKPCVFSQNTFVSGNGNISATAQRVKCNSLFVMREGDSGVCSGEFIPPPPSTTPIKCSCVLKIKKAGQTKVKAV